MNAAELQIHAIVNVVAESIGSSPEAVFKTLKGLSVTMEELNKSQISQCEKMLVLTDAYNNNIQNTVQQIENVRNQSQVFAETIARRASELRSSMPNAVARMLDTDTTSLKY